MWANGEIRPKKTSGIVLKKNELKPRQLNCDDSRPGCTSCLLFVYNWAFGYRVSFLARVFFTGIPVGSFRVMDYISVRGRLVLYLFFLFAVLAEPIDGRPFK